MEQKAIEILENQFEKLPKSLQTFIISNNFRDGIKDIVYKLNLDDKKQTFLENETLMIILGLEPLNDFGKNLKERGEFAQEQIHNVIKNVLEKIINPIEGDLHTFLEKELQEEETEGGEPEKEIDEQNNEQEDSNKKGEENTDSEEIKKMLRKNSKTMNVRNLIKNIK